MNRYLERKRAEEAQPAAERGRTLDYDLDDGANHTYHSITLRAHDGHALTQEEVLGVLSIL